MSKPKRVSEPQKKSNPPAASEPPKSSKPGTGSEPHQSSSPKETSESKGESKPSTKSESQTISKPLSKSEPTQSSKPNVGSEDKPLSKKERIRHLVDIYYDVQDVRISSFNRLRTVGEVEGVHPNRLKDLEKEIRLYIQSELKGLPIVVWLRGIKGIGPILSGGLFAYFDPHKADHASSFWKYAGLHVVDGEAVKKTKGKKIGYNPKLKTFMWKVGRSFMFAQTPGYIDIYKQAKPNENLKLNNPLENPENCPHYGDCIKRLTATAKRKGRKSKKPPCKLHIHQRALRKMVKRFLSDLWVQWRKYEGLPVSPPYAHREKL